MNFDKSKVYTALNADEVKVGSTGCFADSIADLKENVENEETLKLTDILDDSEEYRFEAESGENYIHFSFFYLVEEPKKETYRPYENTDEMIENFKERAKKAYGVNPFKCPMFNSSIWIKDKGSNSKYLISVFGETSVYLSGLDEYNLELLFEDYTYLDGSPCGMKI